MNIADWQAPYDQWARERERNPGPIPTEPDLDTLAGLREWLSHPANWKKTELFVVGWNGLTPWISSHHAWKLAPDSAHGQSLLEVILWDRRKRKSRPRPDDPEEAKPE